LINQNSNANSPKTSTTKNLSIVEAPYPSSTDKRFTFIDDIALKFHQIFQMTGYIFSLDDKYF
jgi:hypothetical protein